MMQMDSWWNAGTELTSHVSSSAQITEPVWPKFWKSEMPLEVHGPRTHMAAVFWLRFTMELIRSTNRMDSAASGSLQMNWGYQPIRTTMTRMGTSQLLREQHRIRIVLQVKHLIRLQVFITCERVGWILRLDGSHLRTHSRVILRYLRHFIGISMQMQTR